MEGATIANVSSEATNHPAEHAITPLEPNFSWEANEAATQHTIVIDLGEIRACDGFTFMNHEVEQATPTLIAVDLDIEYSLDNVAWVSIATAHQSDGTSTPSDLTDNDKQIKLRHFHVSTIPTRFYGRYWRFTAVGQAAPLFIPPNNMRLSMIWLFQLNQLDKGASFPVDDTTIFPADAVELSNGKVYRTGHSVNPFGILSRTWMVTDTEYSILLDVIRQCNGKYRPFVLVENRGKRRLCKFAKDEISEEWIDTGIRQTTFNLVELPVVRKDESH